MRRHLEARHPDIVAAYESGRTEEERVSSNFVWCLVCHTSYDDREAFNRHRSIHKSKALPIPCLECDKWFESKKALCKHSVVHKFTDAERRVEFMCKNCRDWDFSNQSSANRHRNACGKNWFCLEPSCADLKAFIRQDLRTKHYEKRHPDVAAPGLDIRELAHRLVADLVRKVAADRKRKLTGPEGGKGADAGEGSGSPVAKKAKGDESPGKE